MSKNNIKKPFYKRWWFWVIAVLLVGGLIGGGEEEVKKEESASSSSSVEQSVEKSETSESKEKQSEKTSKEKEEKEIKEEVKDDKKKLEEIKKKLSKATKPKEEVGKLVTLAPGTYEVGKDIKPGRYVIKADSGSGNLMSANGSINAILTAQPDPTLGVTSYTTNLDKGTEIKIKGIPQTTFTPVTKRTYQTELGAGTYEVGKDIKPGRYKIVAISGSGNLISIGSGINEILNTDPESNGMGAKFINENLKRGTKITTTLEKIKLEAQ